jgi:hypothetical protein
VSAHRAQQPNASPRCTAWCAIASAWRSFPLASGHRPHLPGTIASARVGGRSGGIHDSARPTELGGTVRLVPLSHHGDQCSERRSYTRADVGGLRPDNSHAAQALSGVGGTPVIPSMPRAASDPKETFAIVNHWLAVSVISRLPIRLGIEVLPPQEFNSHTLVYAATGTRTMRWVLAIVALLLSIPSAAFAQQCDHLPICPDGRRPRFVPWPAGGWACECPPPADCADAKHVYQCTVGSKEWSCTCALAPPGIDPPGGRSPPGTPPGQSCSSLKCDSGLPPIHEASGDCYCPIIVKPPPN